MLIEQMLELQKQLNDKTNGEIWLSGKTKEGRIINWHRCIYMEAIEALDSFNWKHWKDINSADDLDNVKVELIDIWHFIMSEIIKQNKKQEAIEVKQKPVNFSREKLIKSLEKLVNMASSYDDIIKINTEFFNALSYANITTHDLYKNYVVKNILNKFRQDNGYKDGSYNKIWQGKEDNVVAFGIMEKKPNINPNQLYKILQIEYNNI